MQIELHAPYVNKRYNRHKKLSLNIFWKLWA